MAGRKKLTDADREEIIRLNKAGLSYDALAIRFDVHYNTINRICNPEKYQLQKERNVESNRKNRGSVLKSRKENQRFFSLGLTKETDGDMIDHLEKKENVNAYLKSVIRSDMENSQSEQDSN